MSMVTSNQFPAAQNSINFNTAAQHDVIKTKTIGIIVYLAGRPILINITESTKSVIPASIWLVEPNKGHMDKPPEPEAPPAPKASKRQQVTANNVANIPFLNSAIL